MGLRGVLGLACLVAGCASHAGVRAAVPEAAGGAWVYEVRASEDGRELGIGARFPAGTPGAFSVDEQSGRFVRELEALGPSGWVAVAPTRGVWNVSCAAGCAVRYRMLLHAAADALDDVNLAMAYDGAVEAPPSTWLVRPESAPRGVRYRFHVTTPEGIRFATGVRPAAADEGTYEADAADLELAPYSVFGRFRTRTLAAGGARFDLAILPGTLAMDDAALDRWITQSAGAVAGYYGHFPEPRVLLVIVPTAGDDVGGKTLASGGATILLDVGGARTAASIPDDWVMTHEMVHLAFPSLPRRYLWLEEGLATYVEPIARAYAGIVPASEVWRGLVLGLPKGEPEAGDRGLDNTPTWGRTYWGGAMYCLLADLEIRRRTNGAHSLEDALRGIVEAGGTGSSRWPLDRALATGDAAVGTRVLEELHAQLGNAPVEVDLDALWRKLGVRVDAQRVTFDDGAPEAALRRGISGGGTLVRRHAAR